MKRIYVILFTAALSASMFSCENKTSSETPKDRIEEAADSVNKTIKEESKKTTKNGDDAH
ncbi:hypothetical protein [Cytophaga aurantiaca]|uniref:hypothetical protein n=1 Tax=Cytophaga aurantiaca TaxID=29530 RepID=UPI00036A8D77|nr:hypothetical protein [Cytophaga aurantiaca]